MGTVLRVRYTDIPSGRQIGCDTFGDLGATATLSRDGTTLVVTLDVDLDPADQAIATARLVTPDDDQALSAIEAADRAAAAATWQAPGAPPATNVERIADLEAQVVEHAAILAAVVHLLPTTPL